MHILNDYYLLNFSFSTTGLRVADIRVIFKLPTQLGKFSEPLAYVHWFKPFRTWDTQLGMFKLSRSTRQHRPSASIIRINKIVQTCHLIPKFGPGAVPREWFTGNVLNHASDFFFNRYLDLYLFEEFPADRDDL